MGGTAPERPWPVQACANCVGHWMKQKEILAHYNTRNFTLAKVHSIVFRRILFGILVVKRMPIQSVFIKILIEGD